MIRVPGLVLASASPWRLDLLKQVGIVPELVVPHSLDESVKRGERVLPYSKRVAMSKAQAIFADMPDKLVLAADTVGAIGRRILTKPKDEAEAMAWLRLLSGRRHNVYTTVCLCTPDRGALVRRVKTAVSFKRLSSDELKWYISTGDWKDKAGGYGINSLGARFIRRVNGSSSSVAGLPLCETCALLENYICADDRVVR